MSNLPTWPDLRNDAHGAAITKALLALAEEQRTANIINLAATIGGTLGGRFYQDLIRLAARRIGAVPPEEREPTDDAEPGE